MPDILSCLHGQIPSVLDMDVTTSYTSYVRVINWSNLNFLDISFMVCPFENFSYYNGLLLYVLTPFIIASILLAYAFVVVRRSGDDPKVRRRVSERLYRSVLFLSFLTFSGVSTRLCQFFST